MTGVCKLTGAGKIVCAGVIRSTAISIEGQLRRLELCGVHYAFLGDNSTPLVQDPLERLAEESKAASQGVATGRRGRRPVSREIALTCVVEGAGEFDWADVRQKLREWGRPIQRSGPLPMKEVAIFKKRILAELSVEGSNH